jgi:hypothetical protein
MPIRAATIQTAITPPNVRRGARSGVVTASLFRISSPGARMPLSRRWTPDDIRIESIAPQALNWTVRRFSCARRTAFWHSFSF